MRNKSCHSAPVFLSMCLLITFQFLVSACSKDDEKEAPVLEVSPENLQLSSNGEGTLTITSNGQWSISTTADWLSFSTMSGVGNGQVTVRATESSTSDRQAIVTVKGESVSRQAIITQAGIPETPIEPSNPSEQQTQTFNVAGVSFNMVRVDGGTFWMGATAEQGSDADSDEKPAHQVTLSTYYIGETEVTQELWQVVMGSNPSYFSGIKKPVGRVSWNDCQDFIKKLNQMTGKTFRLPTEAEWEYAARGGSKSKGYKYAGSNTIGDVLSYMSDGKSISIQDVATKQANELGIYDMSGNVSEWCQDWYGDYSASQQSNPTGPSTGSRRVCRGFGWGNYASSSRVSNRSSQLPTYGGDSLGLRLAL